MKDKNINAKYFKHYKEYIIKDICYSMILDISNILVFR